MLRLVFSNQNLLRGVPVGVEKQKGFRLEYCDINDEYVSILKDTLLMGVGKTMDESIADLEADVLRSQEPEEAPAEEAVAEPVAEPVAEAEGEDEEVEYVEEIVEVEVEVEVEVDADGKEIEKADS